MKFQQDAPIAEDQHIHAACLEVTLVIQHQVGTAALCKCDSEENNVTNRTKADLITEASSRIGACRCLISEKGK
jgi:hypothetical protein